MPERVYQALVENDRARSSPTWRWSQAVEGESLFDFREAAEQLLMSVAEINRAQLRALMAAGALE